MMHIIYGYIKHVKYKDICNG